MLQLLPNFIPRGSLALPDFPGLFKKSSFKMADSQRIVRVKARTKAFFLGKTLINIPSEKLPKLSKERIEYFCHALKLNVRSRHSAASASRQLFDEQVARTKDHYKFSTAKDPLFNSTGFFIVEDHCRQEHRMCAYRS